MSMYIFSIDMIYSLFTDKIHGIYILKKEVLFSKAYVTSRAGYAKISPSYAMVL